MPFLNDSRNILNAGTDTSGGLFGREDKTDATTNPTRFDDIGANFEIGSIWVNLSQDQAYVCVDNTVDNAIWKITTVQISDQTASLTSTWSSHKINNEKANIIHKHNADVIVTNIDKFTGGLLGSKDDTVQKALETIDGFNPTKINDVNPSTIATYSSKKVENLIQNIPVVLINDTDISPDTAFSSKEIHRLLDKYSGTHESDVGTINGRIKSLDDDHDQRITTNTSQINDINSDIAKISTQVGTNSSDIIASNAKIETERRRNDFQDGTILGIMSRNNAQEIKVAENSRNVLDLFQEFPTSKVVPDPSNENALSRTYGAVTVSVSSILPSYFVAGGISAPAAFDKVNSGGQIGWISHKAFYGPSFTQFLNGDILSVKFGQTMENYTLYRTNVDGVQTGRQWISIDCGSTKVFPGFKLYFKSADAGSNFKDYHIVGSNDNVNFTSLYHETNEAYDDSRIIARTLTYTTAYRYYRIVVNDIADSGAGVNHHVNLQEWAFLQSLDTSGFATTDSVTSVEVSANNVSNDLNKLVNLLNKWIKSGNLQLSAVAYQSDPVREHW